MSGISYTRILLQPGTAEIFSRSLNDWNWPSYFRIQHEEIWLSCSPDSSVWSSRTERSRVHFNIICERKWQVPLYFILYWFQLLWLYQQSWGVKFEKINLNCLSDHALCIEIVLHNQSKTIKISLKLQEYSIAMFKLQKLWFFWGINVTFETNSIIMKCCSSAEKSWPKNLLLQM